MSNAKADKQNGNHDLTTKSGHKTKRNIFMAKKWRTRLHHCNVFIYLFSSEDCRNINSSPPALKLKIWLGRGKFPVGWDQYFRNFVNIFRIVPSSIGIVPFPLAPEMNERISSRLYFMSPSSLRALKMDVGWCTVRLTGRQQRSSHPNMPGSWNAIFSSSCLSVCACVCLCSFP